MSIIGIGCDIICFKRIKKIVSIFGNKFAKRILSENELKKLNDINDKINFIAKRFVVKEALSKALGIGLRYKIKMKNFELLHNIFGKPQLVFLKQARNMLIKYNIKSIHVSISDEKKYVFSVVILENN
ncbi:holo-ACP synthase [Buchnera aphidicola]|uniref:Holo-[acyl-carrier-protein] synthase n=1 Tax=Buchnera aphidicola (Sarucallis kahawaluokalani) TaxID=1241878 RepID=A0A4D6YHZ3_9GAMM|nr:holo-ACP synthase [Buchnera aphidicola]QCI25971.1 holo-ACP synthase [Buchnera aphidicola (Sarucallis kahawaluokalani)]